MKITKQRERIKGILKRSQTFIDYLLDTEISELIETHGKLISNTTKTIIVLIILAYISGINSTIKKMNSTVDTLEDCRERN